MKDYYVFEWEGKKYMFEKYPEDKDKNIVFCCAKNEDEYIREWIEHYLNIGFDKIIIADNNDEEGRLVKVIEDYISRGNVQIFPINGMKGHFQTYIYSMMSCEGNYKWCAYFDCDEFLEISKKYTDVNELFDDQSIKDTDCLYVQWMIYGSNGQVYKEKGKVCERFKYPITSVALLKENMYVKAIVSGKCKCNFDSPHMINAGIHYTVGGEEEKVDNNISYPINYKKCYLKHFITKSFDEYVSKAEKGRISNDDVELLQSLNRYFQINDDGSFNIKKYSESIFWRKDIQYIDDVLDSYQMFAYMGDNPFLMILFMSYIMHKRSGKNIVVNEDIDATMYNILIEVSLRTGNTLIAAKNDDTILWDIFLKTNTENKETYYIYR